MRGVCASCDLTQKGKTGHDALGPTPSLPPRVFPASSHCRGTNQPGKTQQELEIQSRFIDDLLCAKHNLSAPTTSPGDKL